MSKIFVLFTVFLNFSLGFGQFLSQSGGGSYGQPLSSTGYSSSSSGIGGGYNSYNFDQNQNNGSFGGYISSYQAPSASYGAPASSVIASYSNSEGTSLLDEDESEDSSSMLPLIILGLKLLKKIIKKLKIFKILKLVGILLPEISLPFLLLLSAPIVIPALLILAGLIFLLPIPVVSISVPSMTTMAPITSTTTTVVTPVSTDATTQIPPFHLSSQFSRLAKVVLNSEECLEKIFCELESKEKFKSRDSVDRVDIWINSAIEKSPEKDLLRKRIKESSKEMNCSIFPCKKIALVRKSLQWN